VGILDTKELKVSFLAPIGSTYKNTNDWSAVIRVEYGQTAFLFTGDAEAKLEEEMLASGTKLQADVLKIGHHGSRSSTTGEFLKAVSPRYAIICVGKENDYGHPHQETLAKLDLLGILVNRTDQDGTLIFRSDGVNISLEKTGTSVEPRAPIYLLKESTAGG
jgi:beta-lactamase superfamily II metal-dependent hydrolase